MELSKAIKAAARFAARGKDAPEVLKQINFVGNYQGEANWIHATDGVVGVCVRVDRVPPATLSLDVATAISKKSVESIFVDEFPVSGSPNRLWTMFRMADGSSYQIPHKVDQFYPVMPGWPTSLWEVPEWGWITNIVHAANAPGAEIMGKQRPDLECLHFLDDRVEATDTYRMALAEVRTGLTGCVPARIFKNWPAGQVDVGRSDSHAWFKIGDEFRYAKFQNLQYASGRDLRDYVPENYEGPWMAVPVVDLREAIMKALGAAPTRSVFLEFGIHQVTVRASSDKAKFHGEVSGEIPGFAVPGLAGATVGKGLEYPNIIVDGKFLVEALKTMDTPRVRLAYRKDGDSLRLESGLHLEALWQKTA